MDPLQVPLWKCLHQGLHNTWLRRIAYGRETFVLPFDNSGTTVFIAELVALTSHSECGLGQVGGIQITRSWPVRQPEGSHTAHGQGGCTLCNLGYRHSQPPTMPANNAFWNWRLNWPKSNRRTPYNYGDTWDGFHTYCASSARTTIGFNHPRSFVPAGASWIC